FVDQRADRHLELEVGAAVPRTVRAHAVLAALSGKLGMEAEVDQRVDVRAGDDEYRTAVTTVAAARPAARNELLAAEGQTALSAVPGFDVDVDLVDEHLLDWENADDAAFRAVILEADAARGLGEDRVVLAEPGVQAGTEAAAALPHDD